MPGLGSEFDRASEAKLKREQEQRELAAIEAETTLQAQADSENNDIDTVQTLNDTVVPVSDIYYSKLGDLLNDRVKMGDPGIADSGPCLFMSYLGIAQTYAEKNLTEKQVQKLIGDSSLYTKLDGSAGGKKVITAALNELGIDTSVLNIDVSKTIERKDYRSDPTAFGTVREVALRDGVRGHWQEGTNIGGFRQDPIDGVNDIGREVFAYRNVFITKKEQE